MQAAGYETYHHGKTSNTAKDIQARFQTNKYVKDEYDRTNGQPCRDIVNDAIKFLEGGMTRGRFSCTWLSAIRTIRAWRPTSIAELYDERSIPLPKNYLPQHPFDNGTWQSATSGWPPGRAPKARIRRHLHDDYAVISAMDHHIGRLLEHVDKLGLRENTIIIYSADHGLAPGQPRADGQAKPVRFEHEAAAHLCRTGHPAGRVGSAGVSNGHFSHGLRPGGAPTPGGLDGRSLPACCAAIRLRLGTNSFWLIATCSVRSATSAGS